MTQHAPMRTHHLDLTDVAEPAVADVDLAAVEGGRNYTDVGCYHTKPVTGCK